MRRGPSRAEVERRRRHAAQERARHYHPDGSPIVESVVVEPEVLVEEAQAQPPTARVEVDTNVKITRRQKVQASEKVFIVDD